MERWLRFGLKQLLRLHLHLQLHSPFSFPFPFWLWGVRPFCRATMRAKEIKIENSFISIFWQWLGSASLRKNKINSKLTRNRVERIGQRTEAKPNQTKHISVVFLSLSPSVSASLCICVFVAGTAPNFFEMAKKMCQVPVVDLAWTCYNFHLLPLSTPCSCALHLSPAPSSPHVLSAFIALFINEARMCWIVLIGAFATIEP